VVGRCGGGRGGWWLRHGDGEREGKKLRIGFLIMWRRDGDKVSFYD